MNREAQHPTDGVDVVASTHPVANSEQLDESGGSLEQLQGLRHFYQVVYERCDASAAEELLAPNFQDHHVFQTPLFIKATAVEKWRALSNKNKLISFVTFLGQETVDVEFSLNPIVVDHALAAFAITGVGSILLGLDDGPDVNRILPEIRAVDTAAGSDQIDAVYPISTRGSLLRVYVARHPNEFKSYPRPKLGLQASSERIRRTLGRSTFGQVEPIAAEYRITYDCCGLLQTTAGIVVARWGQQQLVF